MRIVLALCLLVPGAPAEESPRSSDERKGDLRVLVWNIQRGANHFDRGPEKALAILRDVEPDLCLLQESYDIDGDRPQLGAWLAGELGWSSWQGTSPHLCVLTKLEIVEELFHADWHGVGARLRDGHGRELVAWSIWIDYRAYLPYALRDDPAIDDEALLRCETDGSGRMKQASALLAHLREKQHIDGDVPLLVGGDWNTPSHLDWTDDAARLFRFRRPLDLPVSRAMADAGFRDAFRVVHPDPTRTPGITWTPLERGTAEAPVPADRIDRLYLNDGKSTRSLRAVAAHVLPRVLEEMSIPPAERRFPSDHGAVVVDLEWVER